MILPDYIRAEIVVYLICDDNPDDTGNLETEFVYHDCTMVPEDYDTLVEEAIAEVKKEFPGTEKWRVMTSEEVDNYVSMLEDDDAESRPGWH